MNSAVASAIVGLATVLMSGVVSSYVTYRLNRNKDQTFFMRQKAEALYLAADEFGREFSKYIIIHLSVAKGEITYNAMIDLQAANVPNKRDGGYETLNMLANIYYQEVLPQLTVLLDARDKFNKLRLNHKLAYRLGEGIAPFWAQQISGIAKEADKAIEALKSAILRAARRHTGAQNK